MRYTSPHTEIVSLEALVRAHSRRRPHRAARRLLGLRHGRRARADARGRCAICTSCRVPQGGFQVDMLIGAGCVARVEAAAVTLGEHGLAPRFTAAIKAGEIEMWDSTCPALLAGLQAAEKGVPVHAAARHHRLRPAARAARLEGDRQPARGERHARSHRHPAGHPPRRDAVSRAEGRRARQRLGRRAARADDHGACVARRRSSRWSASRTPISCAIPRSRPGPSRASTSAAIAQVQNGAWPVGLDNAYPPDAAALGRLCRSCRHRGRLRALVAEVSRAAAPA